MRGGLLTFLEIPEELECEYHSIYYIRCCEVIVSAVDIQWFALVQSLLVMRMHLINPSITRQFISERLEEPANGDSEPETSDRWRNLAVSS